MCESGVSVCVCGVWSEEKMRFRGFGGVGVEGGECGGGGGGARGARAVARRVGAFAASM